MNDQYTLLNFDSKLFGYKVAKITIDNLNSNKLSSILSTCLDDNIKLVYLIVDPKDVIKNNEAKNNNGILVDEKMIYRLDIKNVKIVEAFPNIHSRLHTKEDNNLRSLALQAGIYSRFKRDSNFQNNEHKKMYGSWMERSLSGEIASEVFTYTADGEEKGVITIGISDETASIGLLVVDEQYRGKSVGTQLIKKAISFLKEMGYDAISVVTQKENLVACKFYEHIGFILEKQENTYHFWL